MTAVAIYMGVFVGLATSCAAADTRLADAAERGSSQVVVGLLKQHVDVNSSQPDGATALAWAAYRDDLPMADLLIGAGANANAANQNGVTPLFLACTNRSAGMLEKLLKGGANPNAVAEYSGLSALMRCAATGDVGTIGVLLARGADVNARDKRQGHTALMWALARRQPEAARALIEGGADVNARSNSGFTSLMFAAQQGDLDSTKSLLAAGAKLNERTNSEGLWEGQSALLIASLNGHEALAILLLEKGADPNVVDENGLTALHFCLLRGLARVSRVQPRGYTPFLNRPNMVNLLKALLAHGANPNARVKTAVAGNEFYKAEESPYRPYEPATGTINPVGATAFLMAAMTYDADVMRLLADAGADPKIATEDNVTPLMVAATMGRPHWTTLSPEDSKKSLASVKLTVELGVDVNAIDKTAGLSAVHGAAYSGSDEVIRFLADHGANVNVIDKAGETPVDIAVLGETADGGAGNRRPSLRWGDTATLLTKLGSTPGPAGVQLNTDALKTLQNPEKRERN